MGHPRGRFTFAGALGLLLALSACTTEPKPATALSFTTQPTSGTVGQVMSPAITVGFIDSDRTKVTSGIQADITVRLSGGTAGAVLSGTTTRSTVNTIATFDDLSVSPAGAGYTLTATAVVQPCDDQAPECQSDADFPPKTSDGFNMVP